MKPHFHRVPQSPQTSFSVRHDVQPNFGRIWHYHPELELHFILKGEGVRFIGDNVSNFSAGEITLLGADLPHTWRCSEEYYQQDPALRAEAIVVQFLPHCFGKELLHLPETYQLPRLFERARQGLLLKGTVRDEVASLMHALTTASPINRLILLLSVLKVLTEKEDYETISSAYAFYQFNESETLRLNKVCNYTLTHYKKDISLEEIAAISNLSVTSFCRYFKMMTKKTYYDFLIEIRISHACRYLVEDRFPIGVVCFECGFNNVSNFYRHFKKVTGMTPFEYKRSYLKTA